MFKNIAVGVDNKDAAHDAIELAKKLRSDDGRLALVHVLVVQPKPAPDSTSARDARIRESALKDLRSLRDEVNIFAQTSCVEARSVRRGLQAFAANRDADLLVIGSSRRDEVGRLLLGDDAREVLHDPPCAVAVAPPGYSSRGDVIRKIGVGYDESAESEPALALSRRLASERHAALSAFEAVPAPLHARDVWDVEGEIDEDVEHTRQRIASLGGVEAHAEFAEDPVEGLRRYAAGVDLLVIGPHRYRPTDLLFEGSTAQRLADDSPSPLLVFPIGPAKSRR